ncbi:rolling circle replication-associated protein [Agrobacterium larrymoorei]|uniref:Replication-associated protein ORF2/G2P domain-containing protein n=1 Tax=Agrobacterium larrymoorei TaxID=160699 RepID=A0AAF0KCB4_9HYPH|nr:hypothetical protein [Agrobacterium larrymoorei]WHA39895.1 hypothetical protein CFBP5477_008505 [Agrobacterium larrymoorei]
MCNSPNMLADKSLVACRKCGQCRSNRIDEWVGRCIAESKTSVATTFVTLTYGRDENGSESHPRAAILTYSDVQKYFKQLRNRGYPCRYFVVGELGSKKGRAHWHGLIFWKEDVPTFMTDYGNNSWHPGKRELPIQVPIQWDKRFNEPCWPHGFSHWTTVKNGYEKGSIAYACKYINKDVDDATAQSKLAMSKLPPIGSAYFIERAQKFVDAGISPQDPFYQFPAQAQRKNGNVINFMLRGKVQSIFCEAFITKWAEQIGGHYPPSKYLEEFEDAKTRKESGEYEYLGRIAEEKRHVRAASDKIFTDRRFPMNAPFGYTDRDIFIDPDTLLPTVRGGEGACLYFYENSKGTKGWYPNPEREKAVPSVEQVLKRIHDQPPGRKWRPSGQHQWVLHLSEKYEVVWIGLGSYLLGRYRLMKTLDATGKRVWGKSHKP